MTDYMSYIPRWNDEEREDAERDYRNSEWFQENKNKSELITNPKGGVSGSWEEPCCNKPARNMNGWCVNCNDPCF
jgi:hypothetical protein